MLEKKKRLFYLDFIRAISVIFIVIFHFNVHLGFNSINAQPIFFHTYVNGNLGHIGISLFLIISGAALMYTYENNLEIKQFYWKRFISIYPIFWTAYSIAFLFMFYVNKTIPHLQYKWTFLLTIVGMDGYFNWKMPTYYLVGEWFLGFIILFYIVFPLLRKLVVEKPIILLACVTSIYFLVIHFYSYIFKIEINHNLLIRLPEFLFGMYFIRYIKKPNIYQFLVSLCVVIFLFSIELKITNILAIAIMGICMFVILAYIGNNIKNLRIISSIQFISKYSFTNILVHQLIIIQILIRFNGLNLTSVETYVLFSISYILIMIVSVYIYRISSKFSNLLNEIKSTLFTKLTNKKNRTLSV